jgi:tetratricopeptide (TPR) repeat protein
MHRSRRIRRGLVCASALLLAAGGAWADTIVLKNGRRITALSITDEGDKIRYETAAGTLTLPKSIVDHIERGDGVATGQPPAGTLSLSLKQPDPVVSPAVVASRNEVESHVVHDGGVDRNYLAEMDNNARSGSAVANRNAAVAHHVASQYELEHGQTDRALEDERQALIYAPEQPVFLTNVAYLHLRRSEFTQSLEYLDRAARVSPEDPDIAKLRGWAYYGLNKMDQAVAEWQHALALRPDAEIEAALKKAQRDKEEEEAYRENESVHFRLKYSGAAEPGLAHDVLRTLERHYEAIESELNYSPPDSIGVILYTQEAFADITRAPAWVGALNDGRIRVPVQGLGEVTPDLSRVLKHELTHSFIQQKTRGHAPTWLQEGIAQWMEGKRSGANAQALIHLYADSPELAMAHFDSDWMKMPGDKAAAAYAWALANVECILNSGGIEDLDRIMDRLAGGERPEAATREVTRDSYAELTMETVTFLGKTYGH